MQYTWPSCKTGAARCIIYSMEWVRLEWQNRWWFWGEIIEIQDGTSLMKREIMYIVQISKGANLFVWLTIKEKERAVFWLGRCTGPGPIFIQQASPKLVPKFWKDSMKKGSWGKGFILSLAKYQVLKLNRLKVHSDINSDHNASYSFSFFFFFSYLNWCNIIKLVGWNHHIIFFFFYIYIRLSLSPNKFMQSVWFWHYSNSKSQN